MFEMQHTMVKNDVDTQQDVGTKRNIFNVTQPHATPPTTNNDQIVLFAIMICVPVVAVVGFCVAKSSAIALSSGNGSSSSFAWISSSASPIIDSNCSAAPTFLNLHEQKMRGAPRHTQIFIINCTKICFPPPTIQIVARSAHFGKDSRP